MSGSSRIAIVLMCKKPRAGGTKTRLVPPLSREKAAALSRCMLLDAIDRLSLRSQYERWVAYTPASDERYFTGLVPPDIGLTPQSGGDLGQRMHAIVQERSRRGADGIIIIGSDLPTLPEEYVLRAASLVGQGSGIVLGPTEDGGYYLIGLRKPEPALFENIRWSTPSVFDETVTRATRIGLEVNLLPRWYDVDDASDLDRLRSDLERGPRSALPVHTARFITELDS